VPYLLTMEMLNCFKWSHEGHSYMACDFGAFVQIRHWMSDSEVRRSVDIAEGREWSHKVQSKGTRFTVRAESGSPFSVTAPVLVADQLLRLLERVAPSTTP